MSKDVRCLAPDATLREIALEMKELDVGSIPICEQDRLVGMVTDRDIVIKTFADQLDPRTAVASDVMTSPIVFGFEDMPVDEGARIMEVRQVRRLIILNRDKKLVGIVSLGDLSVRSGSEEISAEVLEKVSEPNTKKVA